VQRAENERMKKREKEKERGSKKEPKKKLGTKKSSKGRNGRKSSDSARSEKGKGQANRSKVVNPMKGMGFVITFSRMGIDPACKGKSINLLRSCEKYSFISCWEERKGIKKKPKGGVTKLCTKHPIGEKPKWDPRLF